MSQSHRREYKKSWRLANLEKINAREKEYRKVNFDRNRENCKKSNRV